VLLCAHLLAQVQEICDRIGIMARGRLVREGGLAELVAIENQTEFVVENADPALLAELEERIGKSGARLVGMRQSQTTLERLFLEVTEGHGVSEREARR